MNDSFTRIPNLIDNNKDAVIVSIIDSSGSSPRGIGSLMLVSENGLECGTVGGGAVEKKAIEFAQELLKTQKSAVKHYSLMSENTNSIGMECGGGHCAYALAPILNSIGFRVTVMDERNDFVTKERFPMAEKLICGDYNNIEEYLDIESEDYIIIMTNGHSNDYEVESYVLKYDVAYIGVIGSRRKTAVLNEKLKNAGFHEAVINRVYAPIGISIKAVTPEEIAISIAGEIIRVRAEQRSKRGLMLATGCPMHQ